MVVVATLPGPSRTIVVEPLERPAVVPRSPEREAEPPPPAAPQAPEREPEPAPA
jgi:hypothetical protein